MLASCSGAALRPSLRHTVRSRSSSVSATGSASFSSGRRAQPQPQASSTHAAAQQPMLSGSGSPHSWNHQPRRSFARSTVVTAMFGLKWPFGGGGDGEGGQAQRKRGCELAPREAPPGLKLATFGGGCFWGLELAYQRVPGVVKTSVGYTGGQMEAPSYEEVCMGITGHAEVVQVAYDEKEVSFRQLLDVYFSRVDPTTLNRQGNDRGTQYRSGIFTHDEAQAAEARAKIAEVNEQLSQGVAGKWLGRKVVATVEPCGDYYLAEKYHQQYLSKGGRIGRAQSAEKGCTDTIRCYG